MWGPLLTATLHTAGAFLLRGLSSKDSCEAWEILGVWLFFGGPGYLICKRAPIGLSRVMNYEHWPVRHTVGM